MSKFKVVLADCAEHHLAVPQGTPTRWECQVCKLQAKVKQLEGKVFEAVGWTHALCCMALDKGNDPRQLDCAEILEKARVQLAGTQEQSDG